jgi:hypothetical protein
MATARPASYSNSWCYNERNHLRKPANSEETQRELWTKWLDEFENAGILEELDTRPQKTQFAFFWMALGSDGQDLARSFGIDPQAVKREQREEKGTDLLDELKTIMANKIEGTLSTLGIEQEIVSMTQRSDETHREFVTRLQKKAKNCTFGAGECCRKLVQDRIAILRLVGGGRNRLAARECTLKPSITLDDALVIYNTAENSDKILARKPEENEVRAMKQGKSKHEPYKSRHEGSRYKPGSSSHHKTHHDQTSNRKRYGEPSGQTCTRCGYQHHESATCPARDRRCRKCNKKGHFADQCTSTQTSHTTRKVLRHRTNEESGSESGEESAARLSVNISEGDEEWLLGEQNDVNKLTVESSPEEKQKRKRESKQQDHDRKREAKHRRSESPE